MSVLELRLLGPVRVFSDLSGDVTPTGRRAQALLAMVALSEHGERTRSWIQSKLWSDRPQEQGSASLRQELSRLRRLLGTQHVVTEADRVALRNVRVDVLEIVNAGSGAHGFVAAEVPDLLEGLEIRDEAFEDWLRLERFHWRERIENAMTRARPPGPQAAAPAAASDSGAARGELAESSDQRSPPRAAASSDKVRRSVAAMAAEVADRSQRLEQDERGNRAQLERAFDLFASLARDYGGEVVDVGRNGIRALFENPETAVLFGTEIQNEFRDQAVWSEGDPIRFRIGIARGVVVESGGSFTGECIEAAASLRSLAKPGGIAISRSLAEAVQDVPGISIRAIGRTGGSEDRVEGFAVHRPSAEARDSVAAARAVPVLQPLDQPSVAVLALNNPSGDPALDHVAEGVVEDVILNLSRFRNLHVIARHSAFLFGLQTHSAREIGERLGVRYLLYGSLRRGDQRLRIAVELIDAGMENVLWSDQFDVRIDELFGFQDEITGAVASRLALQIDLAHLQREAGNPQDVRAYGLVLRGQQLVQSYTKEANAHARRLFEEALEIAPSYGRALSALSRTHNLDWRYEWSPSPEDSLGAAVAYARRAIQCDGLDARAFAELGFTDLYRKRHDEALANYARALALNPNDADIIAEHADALVYAEQPDEAVEQMQRAMRLNPFYPDWYLWYLADAYNALGRAADVIATVRRMQNPAEGSRLLAANYAHLGRMEEARSAAREVLFFHPGFSIRLWQHRPPYRNASVLERYVDGLKKAGLPDE